MNGRFVPMSQACLSLVDEGLVHGATVTERVRTFRHQPYLLDRHLDRLRSSLELTGIADASVADALPLMIEGVVAHNASLIAQWQDLSIVIFVTPGLNRSLGAAEAGKPTIVVHSTPIPVAGWGEALVRGVRLQVPTVRQPAPQTIDPSIKHRSRLHWFLAQREVERKEPCAEALLLDAEGYATETRSANLMAFDGERLYVPRSERVLRGISQQVVTELAKEQGIETTPRDMTPEDVLSSDEVLLTSTGWCLLPATHLNGQPIGEGQPGPLSRRLLERWSADVEVDIVSQHTRAAREAS
jgi:branched-chain amino acid aminotransferase